MKVKHPDFGHVIFTNPTPRQVEILEDYILLTRSKNIAIDEWYTQTSKS